MKTYKDIDSILDDLHYLDELTYPTQRKVYSVNKDNPLLEGVNSFEEFQQKAAINEWLVDINDYMIL